MSTFALVHGAGDSGWAWHLLEPELRAAGHEVIAPDLPSDDDAAGFDEYAGVVVEAIGGHRDVIVVGHSLGGFTAPIVAARTRADLLVFVAAMVPAVGETPGEWWEHTGYGEAVRAQAALDGGLTGSEDPFVCFYHDVPRLVAEEALARERPQSMTPLQRPWPLQAWPAVPVKFVLFTEDRCFPPAFTRRVVAERLGIVPDEIQAGHCGALSRPRELAALLLKYESELR